jgi:thermitase
VRARTLPFLLLAIALLVPEAAAAAEETRIVVKREPGLSAAERADIRADAGVRLVRRLRVDRTEVVSVPAREAADALRELRADADVEYAERDRPVHALTNDPLFPLLWALEDDQDNDLDVPEAWALSTGTGQKVAVVDTGVDDGHPDLAGHIEAGHDYVGNDSEPDEEPGDGAGHGTHVSGTIAATRDNNQGIVGVAPDAKVVPLRVLDPDGSGNGFDIADAFAFAGDLGIRVVNGSFGAEGEFSPERDAIAQHPNTLYVVAAGNGGADGIGDDNDDPDEAIYPCSYDLANILCVGASNENDLRAGFSNFGATTVDVFAPGTSITSTVPSFVDPSQYETSQGTSMATPHVAAIAALLLAHDPSMTVAELKTAIMESAETASAFSSSSVSGGRVNALAALQWNGTVAPPIDTDGDGIGDAGDGCPTVAGPAPTGCPATTVTPPPADPVPNTTTPIDRDGDGKADVSDGCPFEHAKTADGCPIPAFSSLSKRVRDCAKGKRCTRSVRVTVLADRAATVRVTVERKRCTRKRCRWVRVARKSAPTSSKRARVTVSPLRRGSHRAVVRLTSSAGTSKARTLSFKVR